MENEDVGAFSLIRECYSIYAGCQILGHRFTTHSGVAKGSRVYVKTK